VYWTTIGNTSYFAAFVADGRMAVMKTDGTAAGTIRMTDNVGRPDPNSAWLVAVVNGRFIYGGLDAAGDSRTFALDLAGGEPVQLNQTSAGWLEDGVVRDGNFYFSCFFSSNESELCRTDGTLAGTVSVDLLPGPKGSLTYANERRIFGTSDGMFFIGRTELGVGVHRVDRTASNPTLIFPLTETGLQNRIQRATVLGDRFLFHARAEGGEPDALWASDGTAAGTKRLALVRGFDALGVVAGKLLFVGDSYGDVIWATDGTPEGTSKTDIQNVLPGTLLHAGAVVGDELFVFSDGTDDEALFATRGTAATTRRIAAVSHGGFHSRGEGFGLGGQFFFRNEDAIHGSELWKTNGTTAELFADLQPGPGSGFATWNVMVRPDGRALIVGNDRYTGVEPWITDGTAAGTHLLANVHPEDSMSGSSPYFLASTNGRLFFTARLGPDQAFGVSDGTSSGTSAFIDPSVDPYEATASAGHYFVAATYSQPLGLYATDGTAAVMTLLHPQPATLTPVARGVVFQEGSATSPRAVWFSDGTISGTRLLRRIAQSRAAAIAPAGDLAWVFEEDRLWRTDGTDAGTIDILATNGGGFYAVTRIGGAFLLLRTGTAAGGERAYSLWRTDGRSGLTLVKTFSDAYAPDFVGSTNRYTVIRGWTRMYRSDGTEGGTVELPASTNCNYGDALGDAIVFSSYTPGSITVWRTDGTPAGTTKLATMKFFDAQQQTRCLAFTTFGGRAYFSGYDSVHGWEPWSTDGTPAGTQMLEDLYLGKSHSSAASFTVAGDHLFFTAATPNVGRELWAIGPRGASARRRSVGH
nr:hypothetical protein [Acidobacteriota bacterium]